MNQPARASSARRSSRASAPPESTTRPRDPWSHQVAPPPAPVEETRRERETGDPAAAIRAAREADMYAQLRVQRARVDEEIERLSSELIEDMKAAGKERFSTEHGLVTFLPATEARAVPDVDAAVALLEQHGIPQPPTMEEWLSRHGLAMPKKAKAGLPDRIEFRRSK